tara:strand:- start:38886 stop:39278 length:393 start_codon:yes stop_codon:yes gene_type:complete
MSCRIKPKPYKVCIGDLRSYITIKQKTKNASNLSGLNSTIDLSVGEGVWAMQKSVNGEEIFDGINMIGKITDHFYIRYNPQSPLDKTYLVELEGNRYDIIEMIPNVEGRREFTLLKCSITGDATLESTKL